MNTIHTLFDHMDGWRHLPAYQLERRADIFFSAYLAEAVAEFTGVAVSERLIPELPIKSELVWPDRVGNKSLKLDYCVLSKDRTRAFFVELKTDMDSRRDDQDHCLERAPDIGFRRVVEGIVDIAKATSHHQKYAHLLTELANHGCLRLPTEVLDYCFPSVRRGLRSRQNEIEVLVEPAEFAIEVIYVQPREGAGRCIDFKRFAATVDRHDGPVSQRFAESLRSWGSQAGSERPKLQAAQPGHPMRRGSRIAEEYRSRREGLRGSFPAAYDFLLSIEEGHQPGLWLSTASNAHLYAGERFIAYIRLGADADAPLVLSPAFNNAIVDGTIDRSGLLFPDVVSGLVENLQGYTSGWAVRGQEGSVHLSPAAPAEFFSLLLETLTAI